LRNDSLPQRLHHSFEHALSSSVLTANWTATPTGVRLTTATYSEGLTPAVDAVTLNASLARLILVETGAKSDSISINFRLLVESDLWKCSLAQYLRMQIDDVGWSAKN
jgi:hypothetical protein